MSLLRPSIIGRLLKATSPATCQYTPAFVRYGSQTAIGTPLTESSDNPRQSRRSSDSSMENSSQTNDTQTRHNNPDWNVEVDQATSTYSPVPKRVMDGSEDGEVLPAAVLSGAPIELQARTVRIYRPTKTAMQSGDWHQHHWRMDWDILSKGHRWENPLMGWQSSGDFMQGTHLNFKSREEAVAFAEKQGYEYFVQEPTDRKRLPKAYANNFLYTDRKLKQIRTK